MNVKKNKEESRKITTKNERKKHQTTELNGLPRKPKRIETKTHNNKEIKKKQRKKTERQRKREKNK